MNFKINSKNKTNKMTDQLIVFMSNHTMNRHPIIKVIPKSMLQIKSNNN